MESAIGKFAGDESGQAVKTLIQSGGVSLAQESLKAAGTTTGTKIAANIGLVQTTAMLNTPGIAGALERGSSFNAPQETGSSCR